MTHPIRERRLAAGLSQVKLGQKSKVPHTCISDFELFKRTPWQKARRSMARVLGCHELDLVVLDGNGHS